MPDDPKVILIREQGQPSEYLGHTPTFELRYRFVEDYPRDGFAAWISSETATAQDINVAAYCRGLEGGFSLQALNRLMAQALIRERPRGLVIDGIWGCTADLPRIAALLGVPTIFCLPSGIAWPTSDAPSTAQWLTHCQEACAQFASAQPGDGHVALTDIPELLRGLPDPWSPDNGFSYATYEFALRDHPLLSAMQASEVRHFDGLNEVLDVACGAGIFMHALREAGHRVTGVERDPQVAAYARGMGLDVIGDDALAYLRRTSDTFDGIHCSHFVEHVPVAVLEELLELLYQRTRPGGAVVLTFPDPESIRSQLLGFWRDPEHVRFYHPELVAAMATVAGFRVEWTNYDEQAHEVAPFSVQPPELPAVRTPPALAPGADSASGIVEWLLNLLGLQSRRAAERQAADWRDWAAAMDATLRSQHAALIALEARTESLWSVNQTWAWQDNATLRLRRRDD